MLFRSGVDPFFPFPLATGRRSKGVREERVKSSDEREEGE
jgi:hypothetical protein